MHAEAHLPDSQLEAFAGFLKNSEITAVFHRLFNLTSQVQHDNELYFCDRRGRILSG